MNSGRCSSLFLVVTLLVSWFGPYAGAQGSALYDQGIAAYESQNYADAIEAFSGVKGDSKQFAEAQYRLAKIYLDTKFRDVHKGKQAIKEALKRFPNEVRFLELDLWRLFKFGPSFLPIYQAKRRISRANHLLDLDPENSIAHFVLGVWAYEGFVHNYKAVSFTATGLSRVGLANEDQIPYRLSSDLDSKDRKKSISFSESHESGIEIPATSRRSSAHKSFVKAVSHLRRAIQSDPGRREAYTYLMRAYALTNEYDELFPMLDSMAREFPADPYPWLYRGMASYVVGNMDDAALNFRLAMGMMKEEERHAYRDITNFLSLINQVSYANDPEGYESTYWEERDPRYLSSVNERKLEHMFRMAYADLRFGRQGKRGWQTEPGQVIVRYGLPDAEARFSSQTETYLIFHYGDMQFKFMDLVKAGRFTFYSPSAAEFSGIRPTPGVIENDFAIKGPETFRKMPERFVYEPSGHRIDFPYQVSMFSGNDGKTDLYVTAGFPTSQPNPHWTHSIIYKTGVYLIKDGEGIVAEVQNTGLGSQLDYVSPVDSLQLESSKLVVQGGGPYTLSVEFENETADTLGFERKEVRVPSYGSQFGISNLMLAYHVEEEEPGREASIIRKGYAIEPAPWGRFLITQPLYVYFEMYNLGISPGRTSEYEVEAVLASKKEVNGLKELFTRIFKGEDKHGVAVKYSGTGNRKDEGSYLIVDTSSQTPGEYVLALRVIDSVTGEQTETMRDLVLE